MKLFYLALSSCLLFVIPGCKVVDPSEDIPSYLRIDTIEVNITDPLGQGTSSHQLTDAWVYVNSQLLGVFEIPFTVPVISKGDATVQIRGGIKLNGVSNTRVIYPFFDLYETGVSFHPLDTAFIIPEVSYFPTATFPFLEDFETGSSMEKMEGSDTVIEVIKDAALAFEGQRLGAIFLDDSRSYFEGRSKTPSPLTLPAGQPNVFVELNYKNNNPFYVNFGAEFNDRIVQIPVLKINPKENWNKIYVNLSPYVRDYTGAKEYYFYITATKQADVSKAEIYLDNLKLVYSE